MKKEIWEEIKDFPNYEVSNLGNVRNKKTNRILKPAISNKGYYVVSLYNKSGNHSSKAIHRLVANIYLENKNNYKVVNHISGIKTDNRLENLEFCTQSHNVKEAYRLGLQKPQLTGLGKLGIKNKKSKKIKQIDLTTDEVIDYHYGTLEAQRKTSINFRNIHMCLNGKRKSAGGYIWRYANEE